jgi:hypothetical protein
MGARAKEPSVSIANMDGAVSDEPISDHLEAELRRRGLAAIRHEELDWLKRVAVASGQSRVATLRALEAVEASDYDEFVVKYETKLLHDVIAAWDVEEPAPEESEP